MTPEQEIIQTWIANVDNIVGRYTDPQPSDFDSTHHAWMQGGYAADVNISDPMAACPYAQYQYRMAWLWGYDIGRRIKLRDEMIANLRSRI